VITEMTRLMSSGISADEVITVLGRFIKDNNFQIEKDWGIFREVCTNPAAKRPAHEMCSAIKGTQNYYSRRLKSARYQEAREQRADAKAVALFERFQKGELQVLKVPKSVPCRRSTSSSGSSLACGSSDATTMARSSSLAMSVSSTSDAEGQTVDGNHGGSDAIVAASSAGSGGGDKDPDDSQVDEDGGAAGKSFTRSIYEKMQCILHWENQAGEKSAKDTQIAFPHILTSTGQLKRWRHVAELNHWRYLPEDLQRKYHEIPQQLRKELGLPPKGRHDASRLPEEVLNALDKVFAKDVFMKGRDETSKTSKMLKPRQIVGTLKQQMIRYNARVKKCNEKVGEFIHEQKAKWDQGLITRAVYMQAFKGLRKVLDTSPEVVYRASMKFLKDYGWTEKATGAPTGYPRAFARAVIHREPRPHPGLAQEQL